MQCVLLAVIVMVHKCVFVGDHIAHTVRVDPRKLSTISAIHPLNTQCTGRQTVLLVA